jgi:hypothetical protein
MGFLKQLWNILFVKCKKTKETTEMGSSKKEPILKVVHRKEDLSSDKIGGYSLENEEHQKEMSCTYIDPANDVFQAKGDSINHGIFGFEPVPNNKERNAVIIDNIVKEGLLSKETYFSMEKESGSTSDDLLIHQPKKEKLKNGIGQKTLSDIKDYLITYGSLDVLTCEQKFKVKSLHNFIWQLRKDGFKIKTGKVTLHDEFNQKVEVTNYILIS